MLLAACVLYVEGGAASTAAAAEGLYLSLRGGVNFLQDTDMTIDIAGVGSLGAELFYDTGWLAGAAVGYAWANGLAVEGEFTYRQNGVDRETLLGTRIGLDGKESSYATMLNGYYRIDTGTLATPYLGVGIGSAFLNVDAGPSGGQKFNDWDTAFAYQAMAGVSFAVMQQASIGVEYRFFGTTTPTFEDNVGAPTKVDPDYHAHDVLLSLTYSFQ